MLQVVADPSGTGGAATPSEVKKSTAWQTEGVAAKNRDDETYAVMYVNA